MKQATESSILVWDLPLRLFHWLLAAAFAGAFVTAESERWRDVHVMLGYTTLALIAFRVAWGFIGTRYARFASFAFGPSRVVSYLRSLATRTPHHYTGPNPDTLTPNNPFIPRAWAARQAGVFAEGASGLGG